MFPQRQETIFKLTHEKKFSCVRCVDIRGKIQKDRRQVGRLLVYGSYNKLTNSLLLSTTLPKHYFGSKVPRFVTSHLMLHPSLTGGDVKTQKRAPFGASECSLLANIFISRDVPLRGPSGGRRRRRPLTHRRQWCRGPLMQI